MTPSPRWDRSSFRRAASRALAVRTLIAGGSISESGNTTGDPQERSFEHPSLPADSPIHFQRVYFEPWGLGDAIIAAAAYREDPRDAALACHPRWFPILRAALLDRPRTTLLAVALSYTTRDRTGPLAMRTSEIAFRQITAREVLSIRGDLRDYLAARQLFPKAAIRMTGWLPFLARRLSLLDLPYKVRILGVRNRYRAWAALSGLGYQELVRSYQNRLASTPAGDHVLIHVGSQWRSKQYPHAAQLAHDLQRRGLPVQIIAAPGEPVPEGIPPDAVLRPENLDFLLRVRASSIVITNDSGPMHLAALLGKPTLALARTSNIDEWLPPMVRVLASPLMPHGYRPHPLYASDDIPDHWPDPHHVADITAEWLSSREGAFHNSD